MNDQLNSQTNIQHFVLANGKLLRSGSHLMVVPPFFFLSIGGIYVFFIKVRNVMGGNYAESGIIGFQRILSTRACTNRISDL